MKKVIATIILGAVLISLCSCGKSENTMPTASIDSPSKAKQHLINNNALYVKSDKNNGDVSQKQRTNTATNGQAPYAVVVTCSDSRVPPEHIFNAGIGELFVIRTAGNVIGDFELGSIEYGVEHLHAKTVVVLGHTGCGAVSAAIDKHASGYIQTIINEIIPAIGDETDPTKASQLNITNSIDRINQSEVLAELAEKDDISILPAIYDIEIGAVTFLE